MNAKYLACKESHQQIDHHVALKKAKFTYAYFFGCIMDIMYMISIFMDSLQKDKKFPYVQHICSC